jgi:hypothetical protein
MQRQPTALLLGHSCIRDLNLRQYTIHCPVEKNGVSCSVSRCEPCSTASSSIHGWAQLARLESSPCDLVVSRCTA